ncbi:MAG: hypothetical protein HY034_08735 [Nitrospirae bacterium]|nr:hypothetical protein [Nitrospirota bacterium]
MPKVKEISEEKILNILKILPENKKIEAIDFLEFLSQKFRAGKGLDVRKAVMAVENTSGSIRLDRKTLKYIAEDKELEYEV